MVGVRCVGWQKDRNGNVSSTKKDRNGNVCL